MSHWPHSPVHLFNTVGTYFVTASTLHKQLFFKSEQHLDLLQISLFELSIKYEWDLTAWAIFPNHYHFIAHSPNNPSTLRKLLTHFHANTARELNRLENLLKRKIWFQYWDTQITYERSYLARLNYVMNNPVKHGIVEDTREYRWCSARWFHENSTPSRYKVVCNFKTDMLKVMDDF